MAKAYFIDTVNMQEVEGRGEEGKKKKDSGIKKRKVGNQSCD